MLKSTVRGWTSIVFLQIFFSGAILLAIGLVGEYLARVYDESKRRPLYIVRNLVNVSYEDVHPDRAVILAPDRAARS